MELEHRLGELDTCNETFDCRDVKCMDTDHYECLDTVTENILESINLAAKNNLSTSGGNKKSTKNIQFFRRTQ